MHALPKILAAKQLAGYSSLVNGEGASQDRLHLYLSPHFDDAILSCGGLIHAQRQAGERVGVLTLCAGLPGRNARSALARRYDADWSKSGGGMVIRGAENASALSSWGVSSWDGSAREAIYRNGTGAPYYHARHARGTPPGQAAGNAMVVMSARAGCVVSSRVCCTTTLTLLSILSAKGVPTGIPSPRRFLSESSRM